MSGQGRVDRGQDKRKFFAKGARARSENIPERRRKKSGAAGYIPLVTASTIGILGPCPSDRIGGYDDLNQDRKSRKLEGVRIEKTQNGAASCSKRQSARGKERGLAM